MTVQDEYMRQIHLHMRQFSREVEQAILNSREDEWDGIRRLVKRVETETKEPAR